MQYSVPVVYADEKCNTVCLSSMIFRDEMIVAYADVILVLGGGAPPAAADTGIPDVATLKSIKTAPPGYKNGEISMFRKDGKVPL